MPFWYGAGVSPPTDSEPYAPRVRPARIPPPSVRRFRPAAAVEPRAKRRACSLRRPSDRAAFCRHCAPAEGGCSSSGGWRGTQRPRHPLVGQGKSARRPAGGLGQIVHSAGSETEENASRVPGRQWEGRTTAVGPQKQGRRGRGVPRLRKDRAYPGIGRKAEWGSWRGRRAHFTP